MITFRPRLDVLPAAQRRLWPALADVPDTFVLYGGTALALRLAHRTSVDFDFFAAKPLDADKLLALPFIRSPHPSSGKVIAMNETRVTRSLGRCRAARGGTR